MFAKPKTTPPAFSLGLPNKAVQEEKAKKARPLTAEEKYEQALTTAKVYIEDSRARVAKEMAKYNAVAADSRWFYGYFALNMAASMGVCISLGGRIPFFNRYKTWIALGGGYFGSKLCLGAHTSHILQDVVKQIDTEIDEATKMDESTEHVVPDYLQEVNHLKSVKYELMPNLPEAVEARSRHRELSLDDRVDALVDAYVQRKQALEKK